MLRFGKFTAALTCVVGLWASGVQAHPIDITADNIGDTFTFDLTCTIADQCDADNSAHMVWEVTGFNFDGVNTLVEFEIDVTNTSADPGRISTLSFNTEPDPTGASVNGGTVFQFAEDNVGGGVNHVDVCVASSAIGANCQNATGGLTQGSTDTFTLLLTFAGDVDLVTLSDWRGRVQSTPLNGQGTGGSGRIYGQPDGFDDPDNPIPEPGSMMLLGAGLAGLVARRRARRV